MIVRVAVSYDGQPQWLEVMTVGVDDPADMATALRELADECWEAAEFEQITSKIRREPS